MRKIRIPNPETQPERGRENSATNIPVVGQFEFCFERARFHSLLKNSKMFTQPWKSGPSVCV